MSQTFDHSFDVVVVGSGGAAMATALGAVDENLDVVMLESTDKWGGSTAMSGGGLWLPNNPLMQPTPTSGSTSTPACDRQLIRDI